MKYVIYSPTCTPCRYKSALNTIKAYIKSNGVDLEIRNTAFSKENKKLAESIGQALPFVYNPELELSTQLLGVTNAELDRLRGI